jgi:Tol biopolymer transport system component
VPIATSPEAQQRFEREARAVSRLSHPHICVLHDIGNQDAIDFLVMEYVEGETLQQRLRRGPLPLVQALECAIQIAGALAFAHRQGISHRDLKPGNIMLTKAGAKLLDFGVAKWRAPGVGEAGAGPSELPTLTEKGMILGTPQYMAPEQLEGKETDTRTDIFAFGAVLYEMVTGRKAFDGDSQASVIAAILEHDPLAISELQPLTPVTLDRVVKICLDKGPDDRWQDASDLQRELKWIAEGCAAPATGRAGDEARARLVDGRERTAWAFVCGLLLVMLVLAVAYFRDRMAAEGTVRFTVSPSENDQFFGFHSISPDGERLAFIAAGPDGSRLWLRSLDSTTAQPLTAASSGATPIWSPDSRSIAFVNLGKLWTIDVHGGPPRMICDAPGDYAQGAWSPRGVILFHSGLRRALYQVAATGGKARQVLALDPSRQETSHSSPQFLPDGRHFLYFVQSGRTENRGIYLGSLDSRESRRLLSTERNAVYAGPPSGRGHLLFMHGTSLMAQPFDGRRFLLTGEPFPIAEGVASRQLAEIAPAAFWASGNVLAYRQGANAGVGELVWFDRQGRRLTSVGEPAEYMNPALSPDENRIVVSRINPQVGTSDLWLLDSTRGTSSRFTFDPGYETDPAWSPDGNWIAFGSTRKGPFDIYRKPANSSGEALPVLESSENKLPDHWSRDGQVILFELAGNMWAVSPDGDRKMKGPLSIGPRPEISPNGRWVAYESSEVGRPEVYVESFPAAGGKWQVSAAEGFEPHWRRDGKELFYIAGKQLMAVSVETDGQVFRSGAPRPLFDVRTVSQSHRSRYQVAANGQRFLVNRPIAPASSSPITVVMHWTAGLKK